ncbi:MAG: ATP-binding cassette domain-containing protein [Candidatus Aminicenantes bacterium]|nr:MAG: ATP-binding cassette domain-containing protein [Candidatus Aminicenantes bacterium]
MIEVEHLTKKFGDLKAVQDLSFKVEKGKIWGLLGPNAAGKTTTMRILTGYLPATDGKATVADYDVFEQPNEVKKITGYLPENVPLYPEMTVSSYLNFVSEIKQIPTSKRKEAVNRTIEISGLGSVRKRLIKNISRGFKQRVGLAQALIHEPQILILDEPTTGLDPAQIIEIRQLIKSLKGERTIILSTHILAEVTQTCDGVVIINEGKLMASDSLEKLTASYEEREGIFIRLREGGKEKVSLFESISGVEKVSFEDDEFKIEWTKGKDIRDEITKIIVDKELGLIEMRPLAMNIEDLYLKVISGGVDQ